MIKMKHAVNGIHVEVTFNTLQLREALLKKIIDEPGLSTEEIRQRFIVDLVANRFLKSEVSFTLMNLEHEELIESDFKVTKMPTEDKLGTASRCYFIRGLLRGKSEKQ